MWPLLLTQLACSVWSTDTTAPPAPEAPEAANADADHAFEGRWRAWLDTPGGRLPFFVEIDGEQAWVLNGTERAPIDRVQVGTDRVVLDFARYDTVIHARKTSEDGLKGTWRKQRGPDEAVQLNWWAKKGGDDRFIPAPEPTIDVSGRWQIDWADDDDAAIGVFQQTGKDVQGTILTPTGDYRYLAGDVTGTSLRLSTFDGTHAFLFKAKQQDDGTLAGTFWSGTWWQTEWTASRAPDSALPDGFELTSPTNVSLDGLSFPDLDGTARSLDAEEFRGSARILEVFGTWCPNCNDATSLLHDLHDRYGGQGLKIQGLAFELTGDSHRDARVVKRYAEAHGIGWPVLLAGLADKDEASKKLPILDRVRAFPTTIFLDRNNKIRAVHTGFSGPATGEAHLELKAEYERLIQQLLHEST